MKYVLGLLFEYKYYKNPANIKIFSNNQLIDDIDLTEDIKIKNMSGNMLLHKNSPLYHYYKKWIGMALFKEDDWNMDKKEIQIPNKIFIYTLDETVLQNSIKIEITNDNTNYSNGFMTKWSSFTFHDIFLIPTHYLDFKNYKAFEKRQTQEKHNIPNYPDNTYWGTPYSLMWPNEYRVVENGKFMLDPPHWRKWEKGGSFSIELPIIEYIHEKGLKMLGPINYEQLTEKERRRLSIDIVCPLYVEYLKLINTQNETT